MMKIRSLAVSAALMMAFGSGCVIVDDSDPTPTVPGAYEGCSGVGSACLDGTTCLTSPIVSTPGVSASLCTRRCVPGAQCPSSAGRPTSCVVQAGASEGTCYENCASNVDCRVGTVCRSIAGGPSICVPPVS